MEQDPEGGFDQFAEEVGLVLSPFGGQVPQEDKFPLCDANGHLLEIRFCLGTGRDSFRSQIFYLSLFHVHVSSPADRRC